MNTTLITEDALDGQRTIRGEQFPRLLVNGDRSADLDACCDWARENRGRIEDLVRESGAVLFRGFPIPDAPAFDAFISAFDYPGFTYEKSLSNAVRVNVTERVFTANEAPPDVDIYLHHEMAQTPIFPTHLFFFCEIAPGKGGETPLCRSDALVEELREIAPDFLADCEQKGLRYTNIMPGENDPQSGQGRSWRSTLGVADRAAAEERLQSLGYEWTWLEDDCLKATTPILPAVVELKDGRKVFFNQLIAAFRGWKDSRNDPSSVVTFGDGTPIPLEQMRVAIELSDQMSFDIPWQPGDVALVDNFLVMHGRRAFSGRRRVLASLLVTSIRD